MAKTPKSYTPEFKQQIVDLYNVGGTSYPQLEREYGVNRSTISGWIKQLSPMKVSEEETVTLKEYKALQKENQRLKIENEILKKSQTGYDVGAIPLVGLHLPCIFDRKLLKHDFVYGGTGNELFTLKIVPSELLKVNEVIGMFD